jgi:capsular exopolysaccharide synthesis family protein
MAPKTDPGLRSMIDLEAGHPPVGQPSLRPKTMHAGGDMTQSGAGEAGLPPVAPPPAVLASPPTTGALLRALRRRWLLAFSLSILAGLAAAAITWCFLPQPPNTARALLHVAPNPPSVVFHKGESRADFQSYQRTQIALVKSRLVLNAALRHPDVADFAVVREQVDPVAWLQKELLVDFSIAPEIMRIALTGDRAEELKVLVDKVTRAYLDEIVNKENNQRRDRLEKLKEISERYEESLRRKRRTVRQLAEAVGTGDPHTLALKQRFAQEQLAATEKELLQLESELRKLKIDLAARAAREKTVEGAIVPQTVIDDLLQQDESVRKYQARKSQLQQQLDETLRVVVRGEADPTVQRYRAELAANESQLNARIKQLQPLLKEQLRERAQKELQAEVANTRERIALLEELKKTLSRDVSRLVEETRSLNKGTLDIESYKQEIAHAEETAKRVASELEALSVELRAPPRITELEKAYISQPDDKKRRGVATAGAGLSALGLVLFAIAFAEFRSRRVQTVDEVVHGLGLQLLGTVPAPPRRSWRRVFGSDADPDPEWESLLTESLDAARTLFLHTAQVGSIQTLMVSSAVSSEGKTTFATQLAASLARAGRKTVLIDADLRSPAVHRLFDLPRAEGLAEVLTGTADLPDVLKPTQLDHLFLLTAGENSGEAVPALAQGGLQMVIQHLRLQFEFIIVDSAPVLPVADSLLVGQHVDAVILTVLREVSQMPKVHAAHQRLANLRIRVLGAVVCGMQPDLGEADYRYAAEPEEAAPVEAAERGT